MRWSTDLDLRGKISTKLLKKKKDFFLKHILNVNLWDISSNTVLTINYNIKFQKKNLFFLPNGFRIQMWVKMKRLNFFLKVR